MTTAPIDRLTEIDQLRLHVDHDLSAPSLPDLLDEVDALCAALDEAEAERHRWRQAASIGSIHTQADLDRAAQEARAVALEEALNKVSGCDRVSEVGPAIRALIEKPTAEALERVRAEAYLSGWVNGSNGVEPPDFGNPVFEKAPGD